MLLVSGLGLGSGSGESLLGTQLLVDVVTGQLGAEGEQSCAASISRVVLAGNLLSQNTQSRDTINKVPRGRGLWPRLGWLESGGDTGTFPHCFPTDPGKVLDQKDAGGERGGCEDAG